MDASFSNSLTELLGHYGQLWNVQFSQILYQSPSSWILEVKRNHKSYVLKIFTEKGRASEGNSTALLRAWAGNGAVELLAGDLQAQLLEFISGGTLAKANLPITDEVQVMSDLIAKLQANTMTGRHLPSLREHFLSLEIALRRNVSPLWQEGNNILQTLLLEKNEPCVLHGDFHQQNILKSERGWLAIDPKGIFADPAYEVANSFYNPIPRSPQLLATENILLRAKMFSDCLGLPSQRILRFAFVHGLLSAAWSEEDGEDPREVLQIAEILRGLI